MFNFQMCEDCGKEKSFDCKLLLCNDKNGFAVICCIVYAINNNLSIIGDLEDLEDRLNQKP